MKKWLLILLVFVVAGLAGCRSDSSDSDYAVEIDPDNFVMGIDNPYFPRIPGSRYVYEGQTSEGLERVEVEVLTETRQVMGVTATIMRDIVYLDGVLVEDTRDWFAQDTAGNVWYFGEEVDNYENGVLVDHAGSWEAGVDGALPGIYMYADPAGQMGQTYRQEYYAGEAEDMATILSVTEQVTVPYGSYENVLQTRDFTPLEPGVEEHKFYALGIGEIKAVNLGSGAEFVLIEFSEP